MFGCYYYNVGHYIDIFFNSKIETKAATVGTGTETTDRVISPLQSVYSLDQHSSQDHVIIRTSLHYRMSLMDTYIIMTGDVS